MTKKFVLFLVAAILASCGQIKKISAEHPKPVSTPPIEVTYDTLRETITEVHWDTMDSEVVRWHDVVCPPSDTPLMVKVEVKERWRNVTKVVDSITTIRVPYMDSIWAYKRAKQLSVEMAGEQSGGSSIWTYSLLLALLGAVAKIILDAKRRKS
jgi:hypothetical protein